MIQRLIDWLLKWISGDHAAQGVVGYEVGEAQEAGADAAATNAALTREVAAEFTAPASVPDTENAMEQGKI